MFSLSQLSPDMSSLRPPTITSGSRLPASSEIFTTWRACPEDLRLCAVSLPWLRHFCQSLVPQDYSTQEVVDKIIIPRTSEHSCACVALIPDNHVGPGNVFISHRWADPFHALVDKACTREEEFCKLNTDVTGPVFVWLDIFAINQQGPDGELSWFKPAIFSVRETWVMLDPEAELFTRLWCIYEIWLTLQGQQQQDTRHNGVKFLAYRVPWDALIGAWANLDVETAETFKAEDKIKILGDVQQHVHMKVFNHQVRTELLNCAGTLHEKYAGYSFRYPPWAHDANQGTLAYCQQRARELEEELNAFLHSSSMS